MYLLCKQIGLLLHWEFPDSIRIPYLHSSPQLEVCNQSRSVVRKKHNSQSLFSCCRGETDAGLILERSRQKRAPSTRPPSLPAGASFPPCVNGGAYENLSRCIRCTCRRSCWPGFQPQGEARPEGSLPRNPGHPICDTGEDMMIVIF